MIANDLTSAIKLLKSKISAHVYTGQIPESQTEDSILLSNIANPTMGRTIEGGKYGCYTVYRATIVSSSLKNILSIISEFEDLDNTQSDDFKRILTETVNIEDKTTEQPFQRAFVDVTVYKR